MLNALKLLLHGLERLVMAPFAIAAFGFATLVFNSRLGKLRWVMLPFALYAVFAFLLVYVYAPIRGATGEIWMGKVLRYADERSLGTAIYDVHDRFVGMFDPLLDSAADFNASGKPIKLPNYIAYPDHKSLHVAHVPAGYWACLAYHEDRHINGVINPFGIDLFGVLKIPFSTIKRTLQSGRIRFGVGGSTLAMQLARTFFKTPPSPDETAFEKLARKAQEWWLAPVIQVELTRHDNLAGIKEWTANHFPLAQRTGGSSLYGVEQTSLVVFGKPSSKLTTAESYVLAAAVNKPIILLKGGQRLNAVRMRNWRYITRVRAGDCARALIGDPAKRNTVLAELQTLSQRAPDPRAPPEIASVLRSLAPGRARPARANPVHRSNALLPAVKYGARDEIRSRYGKHWRNAVRAVHLTLDASQNLRFREGIEERLAKLQERYGARMAAGYTLDPRLARANPDLKMPDVVIAAADADGNLVRYYEANQTAAYFGSAFARNVAGDYDPARESRAIASVGKMIAAVAIANAGTDSPDSRYVDAEAPQTGLDTCRTGTARRLRRARVAFACSLNVPIEWRLRRIAPAKLKRLVEGFGMARGDPRIDQANLAHAITVGQIAGSPQTVERMAGTILAALDGRGRDGVRQPPSLIGRFDLADGVPEQPPATQAGQPGAHLIEPRARKLIGQLLSRPVCNPHGTLHRVGDWCAGRRAGVALHIAKTGTRGNGAPDPAANDTVDLWVAGGIKFAGGPAYSYVIMIGTGNPSDPWARDLYSGATTAPLHRLLLQDLEDLSTPRTASAALPARNPQRP